VREVCLLFAGPLIRVTDVICCAPRGDRGGEEHSDVPELVVARRGVFVVHRGGRTVAADPYDTCCAA
jgi:hypothetical protein